MSMKSTSCEKRGQSPYNSPSQPERLETYKTLFQSHLNEGMLSEIRSAWETGTPLGNDYFWEKIEAKLKCKVGQARRGRPKKSRDSNE